MQSPVSPLRRDPASPDASEDAYEEEAGAEDSELLFDESEDEEKPAPRAQKPKKSKRALAEEVEGLMDVDEEPKHKRKASEASIRSHTTTKKAKSFGGLRDEYERGRPDMRGEWSSLPTRSSSVTSAVSVPRTVRHGDSSDGEAMWGPVDSDEDEEKERQYAAATDLYSARSKTASIAGIVPTSIPELVEPRRRNAKSARSEKIKHRITLRDLPDAKLAAGFNDSAGRTSLSIVGSLKAWDKPSDAQQLNVFNRTNPEFEVDLEDPDDAGSRRIVLKLLEERAYTLYNKIGSAALAAVDARFRALAPDVIKTDVEQLLEIMKSDKYTEYRVFYYPVAPQRNVDAQGVVTYSARKKIFCHPLILAGFAVFCKLTRKGSFLGPHDEPETLGQRPCGALGLAVQAVIRALDCYKTGTRVPAHPDHPAKFSQDLWGDRPGAHGISKIHAVIQSLRDKDWDVIVASARAAAAQKPTQAATTVLEIEDDDGAEEERVALFVDDSDEEEGNAGDAAATGA